MNSVNPPGFDMRNAQSRDDIVWPLKACGTYAVSDFTSDTWGRMIVDDRKASMSLNRMVNNVCIGRKCIAERVRNQIDLRHWDDSAIY